ncbi:MAG: glutamine--fructose-6-phosphate transaminase (isomerizing) [Candidatus Aenigmarchaeota archaeon]|nr:glutamine--fructose-6-phosphate transaminase (isomerizing) [Candidatus Aenigmarchaeota archaeon]
MCGIIGYTGNKKASKVVLKGLMTLEYRGYDSAGIVTLDPKIRIQKNVGKINQIDFDMEKLPGNVGIGHTRWATHGGVTKENCHPHISNNGKIAVVHNGIIENYQELRTFLEAKGFVFNTQTDTEVIPNLIEMYMKENDFLDAVKKSIKMLEGSYALAIVCEGLEKVIAVRKDSPLVVGVGDEEFFVASDVPAFIEHTKKVIYLHENDLVIINKKLKIFNLKEDREVERPVHNIDWDMEQAKKGNFEHFMLKEIAEQTESIKKSLRNNTKEIERVSWMINDARKVYLIGCGSSYHACLSASYKFSSLAKKHLDVVLASEFSNYRDLIEQDSLVIAVSQSGETADILEAVKSAKEKGAKVVSIVNVTGSSLTRESDELLMMNSGPEISVLSTKTYTSQLVVLTLLAYATAGRYDEGKAKIKDLINYVYYITSANARDYIRKLSEKIKDSEHIYLIGRGLQYPTALEAALKIKEVSYIHAEGFAGGELKHGAIAMIEKGTPCIVFTSDLTEKEMVGNASELKARGAYIIGIGPRNNDLFDFFIKVMQADEANSICQIIPIQILAYQLALLRGCDPDRPRNLAKSVTVK